MNCLAEIKAIKEVEEGTYLKVFIPNKQLRWDIERLKQGGKVTAEMRFNDPRKISNEQRKMFYANVGDIAKHEAEPELLIEWRFKYLYCIKNDLDWISMSNCSVSDARELITMQIDYILEHNIPLTDHIKNRVEDIDKYLYKCLMKRICCITGKPGAEVHHVDKVGMGRNRKKISHKGLRLIALSREWHTKVHQEGEREIFNKYKIYGLVIDDIGLKKLGLLEADIS